MKVVSVINLPDDAEKIGTVYENLQNAAIEKGIELKTEVAGLENDESVLTEEEINQADYAVIITDTEISKERFGDKNVIELPSDEVLQSAEKAFEGISEVIETEEVEDASEVVETAEVQNSEKEEVIMADNKKSVYEHLSSGVSAIIPLIIVGGLLNIVAYFFGIDTKIADGFAGSIVSIASTVLIFIVPLLGAFIANSIAEKDGFVPGLIAGAFAAAMGAGFLGGIIAGFLAGYITKWIGQLLKLPVKCEDFKSAVLVPILSIFVVGIIMIYLTDPAIKFLFDTSNGWVRDLSAGNEILLGAIVGLFVAFDVGGPFSKSTLAATFALVGTGALVPQAAAFAAAMVPPLGLALATVIAKDKFNDQEKQLGKVSWLLGLSGLTEGAIPFAVADPVKVIPSVMIGSGVAGALAAAIGSTVNVANGGLFALTVKGAISGFWFIALAIIIGAVITALLVKYLKK